ncbi:hypothetical protein CC2G_014581 [Coprinopsis cinerea AmutBmut pab1-1]|nr:hypothetical protein CC2G_014581 [Coprinopsis cinerea AmutBmut pab1-1]
MPSAVATADAFHRGGVIQTIRIADESFPTTVDNRANSKRKQRDEDPGTVGTPARKVRFNPNPAPKQPKPDVKVERRKLRNSPVTYLTFIHLGSKRLAAVVVPEDAMKGEKVEPGALYINKYGEGQVQIWVLESGGRWVNAEEGTEHPTLTGYGLSLQKGDGSWVKSKSLNTYRYRQSGRLKREAGIGKKGSGK